MLHRHAHRHAHQDNIWVSPDSVTALLVINGGTIFNAGAGGANSVAFISNAILLVSCLCCAMSRPMLRCEQPLRFVSSGPRMVVYGTVRTRKHAFISIIINIVILPLPVITGTCTVYCCLLQAGTRRRACATASWSTPGPSRSTAPPSATTRAAAFGCLPPRWPSEYCCCCCCCCCCSFVRCLLRHRCLPACHHRRRRLFLVLSSFPPRGNAPYKCHRTITATTTTTTTTTTTATTTTTTTTLTRTHARLVPGSYVVSGCRILENGQGMDLAGTGYVVTSNSFGGNTKLSNFGGMAGGAIVALNTNESARHQQQQQQQLLH